MFFVLHLWWYTRRLNASFCNNFSFWTFQHLKIQKNTWRKFRFETEGRYRHCIHPQYPPDGFYIDVYCFSWFSFYLLNLFVYLIVHRVSLLLPIVSFSLQNWNIKMSSRGVNAKNLKLCFLTGKHNSESTESWCFKAERSWDITHL